MHERNYKPAPKLSQKLTASEIIDRSLAKYRENLDIQHDYIFRQREVNQELDGKGQVKKTEIHTYEVFMPCRGDWYEKLVEKDDKPLNDGEQKKESREARQILR